MYCGTTLDSTDEEGYTSPPKAELIVQSRMPNGLEGRRQCRRCCLDTPIV